MRIASTSQPLLMGRRGELAACREALAGNRGRAVAAIIAGPPGIGKTSLWRAVASEWQADAVVLRTTGVPGAGAALSAIADLVDPVADTGVPALPAPLANALLAALGRVTPRAPVTDVLLERAMVRLFSGLADAGLVIAVDDEQWLDEDSRRLLATIAVRLADVPVRWLVSTRAGDGLPQVLAHELGPGATRIAVAGLPEGELSDLVMSRFPGQWSAGVLRKVVTLAAGNPYVALEVARETVACGEQDGTVAHAPPSLCVAMRRRLERLGPGVLAVVHAAALVATPTRGLLRAVLDGPVDDLINAALDEGVLAAAPPSAALWFSHPLLREAAEAMLADSRRRELHRTIGAALGDPHEAAWHLALGAEEPDEALALRLDEALRDAAVRGAAARAVMLARAAVDLTPDPDGLDGWRRRLTWLQSLTFANEYGHVQRQGARWATEVPAAMRGALDVLRARAESNVEAHCDLLTSAVAELAGPAPVLAALAYAEAAIMCGFLLGRLDQARRLAAAAIPLARAAGYQPLLRGVLAADGLLAALGGDASAAGRLRSAVALPGFEESPYPYETPESALAAWHAWRGELATATSLLVPIARRAEQLGVGGCAFNARIALADVAQRAGDLTAAQAHADVAARWHRESGVGAAAPLAFVLSAVAAGRGDVPGARARGEEGLRAAEAERDWGSAAQCRWALGQLELSVDDPAAALGWLEPVSDMLQANGIADPGCYPFTPDLIEAWARTGSLEAAAGRLAWLQDAAARLDSPWARVVSGRAEAALRLAQRDPGRAIEAVTEVIPRARGLGLPLEVGRCLLILGTAQRKARRRREAAACLDEAIATFRGLGSPRWAELAQAQRARLAAGPGDDTLTPTERRIAGLVASGHSNPEIAAALFVHVKTVEANLTRIYRKLGLRGRLDLARHDLG